MREKRWPFNDLNHETTFRQQLDELPSSDEDREWERRTTFIYPSTRHLSLSLSLEVNFSLLEGKKLLSFWIHLLFFSIEGEFTLLLFSIQSEESSIHSLSSFNHQPASIPPFYSSFISASDSSCPPWVIISSSLFSFFHSMIITTGRRTGKGNEKEREMERATERANILTLMMDWKEKWSQTDPEWLERERKSKRERER